MAQDNNRNRDNSSSNNSSGSENNQSNGRGFQNMDEEKRKEIASNGGKAAHQSGRAHQWNSEEAKLAGRAGGQARAENQRNGQSSMDDEKERSDEDLAA